ncbi:UNVERIFIED_CONTAM: hypothetical protein FKN15_027579 [Acipenser sinensis]
MLCCFLRSALLDALDAPTVLVEREREPAGRKRKRTGLEKRNKERAGKHLGRPRVLYRLGSRQSRTETRAVRLATAGVTLPKCSTFYL